MRLILGYAPGNAPDIVARLIGEWLSERLGQPFIIENRPGAGTNIGTESFVQAAHGVRGQLLPVGRHALRGVREAREVFTI